MSHFLVEGLQAGDRATHRRVAEELAGGGGGEFSPQSFAIIEALRAAAGGGEAVLGRDCVARRFALYARAFEQAPAGIDLGARLGQARVLLDLRLYFEAHEILEPAWMTATGEARDWLQGVIQASVAWAHMEAGNRAGAHGVALRAVRNLERAPHSWAGFDLSAVRVLIGKWVQWLGRPESVAGPPPPLPGGDPARRAD